VLTSCRQEKDQLKSVARCRDGDSIMLATSTGKVIRIEAASLVPQSRNAGGNKVPDDALALACLSEELKKRGRGARVKHCVLRDTCQHIVVNLHATLQGMAVDAGAQLVGMAVIPAQLEPDAPGSQILLATSQVKPANVHVWRRRHPTDDCSSSKRLNSAAAAR
jgi:DNA gyrase/topoisomerase IV subunit A